MIHNAEKAGKKVTRSATGRHGRISAGNIAYYTLQHLKSGRRSSGFVTADVYGPGTQIKGRTRLNPLEEVVASDEENGGEIFLLHDVLADHHQEDPVTKATRKMDWEEFVSALPKRERVAIEFMAEGRTLRDAAHFLMLSDSAMQLNKRYLRVKILEFMGSNILAEVNRQPQWKQKLVRSFASCPGSPAFWPPWACSSNYICVGCSRAARSHRRSRNPLREVRRNPRVRLGRHLDTLNI